MSLEKLSAEILELIESGTINSKRDLNNYKARLAKKHSLEKMPTNPSILLHSKNPPKKAHFLLSKKPVRSMSGISVVAAMVSPHECPGQCIYCPSSMVEKGTPKSYTGKEPAAMRALQASFDPAKQVRQRLKQLRETGHPVSKVEFIVMGGTFLSQSKEFQEKFALGALNAFTGKNAKSIQKAREFAEKSNTRITGITFETRPDYCSPGQINRMLFFGGTRCELGVQILSDFVYEKIRRGHSVEDVKIATKDLKDAGFKVLYHAMPGLPHAAPEDDLESFKKMFSGESFKPDMLKIYPCLVIKGTKLYEEYVKGNYEPLGEKKAVKIIAKVKETIPRWVRIMRVQRDIPSPLIEAGVKKSNIRQLAEKELEKRGKKCNCIRCREAPLREYKTKTHFEPAEAILFREKYRASDGTEYFFSFEDKKRNALFGYCRLRLPDASHRKEIGSRAGIVRELRVFGEPLLLGERKKEALQHHGFGKRLFAEAEKTAQEVGKKKLAVIAGLGVREYYRKKLECKNDGFYVSKTI